MLRRSAVSFTLPSGAAVVVEISDDEGQLTDEAVLQWIDQVAAYAAANGATPPAATLSALAPAAVLTAAPTTLPTVHPAAVATAYPAPAPAPLASNPAYPAAPAAVQGPTFCGYPCTPTLGEGGLPTAIFVDGKVAARHDRQGDIWYSVKLDNGKYQRVLNIPKGEKAPEVKGL